MREGKRHMEQIRILKTKESPALGKASGHTGFSGAVQPKFEESSGVSFDDVRVYYNSSRPAGSGAAQSVHGSFGEFAQNAPVQMMFGGRQVGAIKTYQTYTKTHPRTNFVYAGRTSGFNSPAQNVRNRDSGHHMNQQGYGPALLDKSSGNKDAIRGREQMLIDYYRGLGRCGNAINGIANNNPNRARYIAAARNAFGRLG